MVIPIASITWSILSRIGPGQLSGDIVFHRGDTIFYFPLVTCIIALYWFFNR